MSGGLGLDDFLNHNKGGGGGKFFNWRKEGKAEIWLSTRAKIAYPVWSHIFPIHAVIEVDDKKGGKVEKEIIRRPRWVSPDPEVIHKEQYFRWKANEGGPVGEMKKPPIVDPFLLLREWLRREVLEGRISEDTVVFRWENPDPRDWEEKIEEWCAGRLAKLVDSNKKTWSHSLDSKLEYLFVICDDNHPEEGMMITREAKAIGEAMQKEIGAQIESNGRDAGNPLVTPYCFRWTYDENARSFNDKYRVYRFNKAKLTDEIRDAIQDPDFPDPTPQTQWKKGDKARIRAAFEDAAQIELPYDELFLDAWKDEDPSEFAFGHNAPPGDSKTMGSEKTDAGPPQGKPASSSSSKNSGRKKISGGRRKKAEAKPEPEPTFEVVPCDECDYPMHERWSSCPNCGQDYTIEDGEPMKPPPIKKLETAGWKAKHAPKPEPEETSDDDGDDDEEEAASSDGPDECWACQTPVTPDMEKCPNCGIELGDDIPFG